MRIQFTPSIYEHAARFVGRTPYEVSRDAELLFQGHRQAWLTYRHQWIVVGIDLFNVEAEAYGAPIEPAWKEAIPSISRPPFHSIEEALAAPPFDPHRDGRIGMLIDVGRRLAKELPEADVRIPMAGPFSIAFNLIGVFALLEGVKSRPDVVSHLLVQLADNQRAFCRAVADAGLDVVFVESAAAPPLLSPEQFRAIELPALERVLTSAKQIVGQAVPCLMAGNTYPVVDDLLAAGPDYVVCNVETNQQAFVDRVRASHPDVTVRINMDPRIVAYGDRSAIVREVERTVAIAKRRRNCLLGTSSLPLEAPPENVALIQEYLS